MAKRSGGRILADGKVHFSWKWVNANHHSIDFGS